MREGKIRQRFQSRLERNIDFSAMRPTQKHYKENLASYCARITNQANTLNRKLSLIAHPPRQLEVAEDRNIHPTQSGHIVVCGFECVSEHTTLLELPEQSYIWGNFAQLVIRWVDGTLQELNEPYYTPDRHTGDCIRRNVQTLHNLKNNAERIVAQSVISPEVPQRVPQGFPQRSRSNPHASHDVHTLAAYLRDTRH